MDRSRTQRFGIALMAAVVALGMVGCGQESGLNLGAAVLAPDVEPVSLTTLDVSGTTFITPQQNETFIVQIGIRNSGAANAKAFKVRVAIGGTIAVLEMPSGLAAGATVPLQLPFETAATGAVTVTVTADAENQIYNDINPGNNTATYTIFVSTNTDGGGGGGTPVPIIANG